MDEGKLTFGWFDSSFDFFFYPVCPLSSVSFLSAHHSVSLFFLPSLISLNLILSVSLLKPKCCCEGREPWKSEWPCPLRGRGEQREGDPGDSAAGHSEERQTASAATLGPAASAFFFSGLPSPKRETKTVGLGHRGSRDSAGAGIWGALSGQWWSGHPSNPGTHDGAWRAISLSSPECKHLR